MGLYDDLATEEVQRAQAVGGNVGMSLAVSADRSPDTEATFQRISQRTGVPVATLRLDNAKSAKKQELLQQTQDLPTQAPTVAQFVADPQNADVAHDDINNLTGIEKTIAQFLAPTRDFLRNIGKSAVDAPLVPIAIGRAVNKGISNAISAMSFGDLTGKDVREALPFLGTDIYDQAEDYWKPIIDNAKSYLATPEPKTALEQVNAWGAAGIGGAVKMLPAMGFGVPGMAAQSGLEEYDRSENLLQAGTSAAKSAIAMKLMGANKGMGTAKSVGWVSGVSGVDSFVTTLAQTGDVKAALGEGVKSAVQMATMDIANRGMMPHPGAVYDTISQEGAKAGLPEGVTDTLAQLSQQTFDQQTAINDAHTTRTKALLEQAGQIAQDSALNARMSEKFEGLVKDIKDNYGVEDAHIPVEDFDRIFNQAGVDPQQVAETLLSDPSTYHEAKATGTDVVVPLEELVTRFSTLPQYTELAQATKLGVGGTSQNEIDLFNAHRDTQVKQFIDQAEQAVKDQEPARKVYQDVHDKLVAAGHSPDIARWEALLVASRQAARAAARGEGEDGAKHDAWSVYQERPTEIVNAALEQYKKQAGAYEQAGTKNRGSIQVDNPDRFTINLFKDSDLSTFLHESSHQFLEEMATDAQRDDVSAKLKEDFQSVLKWMGVSSWSDVTREHHEQWAKAFEDYLRTGKAPSLELQPAFQRFKGWIHEVYRRAKSYFSDSKLNPEVTGVMDRMLASEEEIEHARQAQEFKPLFATAEEAGMTHAQFVAYLKEGAEAGEKAKENLLRQLIEQMDRERAKSWREQSKRVSEEVMDEAKQMPVYQALRALISGKDLKDQDFPIKIDRQALVDTYGEEFVKELPRGFSRIYAKEGGWHPDEVAEMFGFDSGQQMLREMTEAPKLKDYVKAETDRRMKEMHGDLMTDGSITERALELVHNERQGEILRAELKAIRKKQREVKPFVDAAEGEAKEKAKQDKKESDYNARWKEAESKLAVAIERGAKQAEIDDLKAKEKEAREKAQQGRRLVEDVVPPTEWLKSMAAATMSQKRDREIQPHLYSRAEAKYAREAFDAVAKGDWEKAAEAKYKQILNHYLYREAASVRKEVQKTYEFFKKVSDRKWQGKNIGMADQALLNQVQAILERYEFRKVSNVALENRLAETIERFKEEYGRDVPVDERLLYGTEPRNYRDIPVEELRAVRDTIKAIVAATKAINQVRGDAGMVELHEAQDQTAASIKEHKTEDHKSHLDASTMSGLEKAGKLITGLFDGLTRPERNIFERYDGGVDGPMHQYIWNRMLDAKAKYEDLMREILPDILEFIDRMPKGQKKQINDPTLIEIRSLKKGFSKSQLIGMALNMGSISNLDKLMRGGYYDAASERNVPISHEAIEEIKGKLSEEDWHLVQHIWDQLAKLKPHMAELEKRWNGIEPVWVEVTPVETKYGKFDGGYYPMVGAREGSQVGEKMANSQEEFKLKQFADSFSSAATRRGHLKERSAAAYALNFDWQTVVTRHLNDVITDIAFREPVFHANRLLGGLQTKYAEEEPGGESRPALDGIPDPNDLETEYRVAPVKAAIIKKYGLDDYLALQKWLEGVVSYNSTGGGPGAKAWENFMAFTRSRATAMHIAYRLDNSISEAIVGHFFQAWQRLPYKYIVHGALAATVAKPGESWQFVLDNSHYYQHLEENVNQSFTEAMHELTGKHDVASTVMRFGMELKAYCYKTQAVATFLSAYKHGMEELYSGLDPAEAHDKAARYADKVIRTTTESGAATDLSPWERSPIGRNVTQWMGPVIIQLNNYIHAVNETSNMMDAASATGKAAVTGLASATPLLLRTLIGGYLANAILFPLLKGKSPDVDDDKEKWMTWILAKLATAWGEGIPAVREGSGWLESKLTGEYHRVSSLPLAQMAVDAGKLPYDAVQYARGNAEGKTVAKDALNVGGWVFGLPSSQLGVTGQYLYDVLTGEYQPKHPWSPVKDILYPRPHE